MSARWALAADGRHLTRDGRDDVLLADTLWAALHRAEPDAFARVLDVRAEQGFDAVMMSALPIAHDRSGELHAPFAPAGHGYDFARLDDAWLERAAGMVAAVAERGLTPVVMLSWVNYVPGTWASRENPALVVPDDAAVAFTRALAGAFGPAAPLWSVSGDDTFTSSAAVERYELLARTIRAADPAGLVLAHTGGWVNLPERVAAAVDVVGFQSGHDGANWADNPQSWNRYLAAVDRPRMNLEPPYEGHGFDGGRGRYRARQVRLASWRSMITGAGAGLGYGAHGLWSWHRAGEPFSSEGWSGMPFDHATALGFPGARDVAWLRDLAVEHRFWELTDRSDLVVRDRSGVRVGATADLSRVVIHAPHPFSFEVQVPHADYDVAGYDVEARAPVDVATSPGGSDMLVVGTPAELAEHAYVLTRR